MESGLHSGSSDALCYANKLLSEGRRTGPGGLRRSCPTLSSLPCSVFTSRRGSMVQKDVRRCGLYVPKDALQTLALWPLKILQNLLGHLGSESLNHDPCASPALRHSLDSKGFLSGVVSSQLSTRPGASRRACQGLKHTRRHTKAENSKRTFPFSLSEWLWEIRASSLSSAGAPGRKQRPTV